MNIENETKEYTIILKKSGEQYVSLCVENMVVGCGETKDEAINTVKEAILSYEGSVEEGMSLERPLPLNLLHEFLADETQEIAGAEELPRLRLLVPLDSGPISRSTVMNLEPA